VTSEVLFRAEAEENTSIARRECCEQRGRERMYFLLHYKKRGRPRTRKERENLVDLETKKGELFGSLEGEGENSKVAEGIENI